jgi:hypothetical protein
MRRTKPTEHVAIHFEQAEGGDVGGTRGSTPSGQALLALHVRTAVSSHLKGTLSVTRCSAERRGTIGD